MSNPRTLDLMPFCDQTGRLPALAAPWTDGGFTYASDGCAIVRIKADPDKASTRHPMTPAAEKMFFDHAPPKATKPIPFPLTLAREKPLITCRDCHGSGAVLGEKEKPLLCPRCRGKKSIANSRRVAFGDRDFAAHYLLRIAALPGIRVYGQTARPGTPLRFVFDGGTGLLMPLQPRN